ncbi:MAG TPA: hypothetical protein VGF44_00270 [Terriglobales bacterium]
MIEFMWPSEETTSRLFNLANVGLLFSLALGVICTGVVVWMGNAKERFSNERISANEKEAQRLSDEAARFNEEAARLNEKAESERTARVEIEKEIQPRTITDPQQLIKELEPFGPEFKGRMVKIGSQMFDLEANRLAWQLQEIFSRAGIQPDIHDISNGIVSHTVFVGVQVLGPTEDQKFVKFLAKKLSAFGHPVILGVNPEGVSVFIGTKPIPDIPK